MLRERDPVHQCVSSARDPVHQCVSCVRDPVHQCVSCVRDPVHQCISCLRDPVPIVQEADWSAEQIWKVLEKRKHMLHA